MQIRCRNNWYNHLKLVVPYLSISSGVTKNALSKQKAKNKEVLKLEQVLNCRL